MARRVYIACICAILAISLSALTAEANEKTTSAEECGQSSLLADPHSTDESKYAPDRKVDIKHVAIDVTPDFDKRNLRGRLTITFDPIEKPLDELRLDAVDLNIDDVKSSAPLGGFQATTEELIVNFAKPLNPGTEQTLTIDYSCHPLKGMYFRVPSNGYPADETHLFTQGEMIDARHWFPCYDYPNEKFTSEITCHVPQGMTVLSNGQQISSTTDASGLQAVRWLQSKPHVSYLITLVAGNFNKIEDTYRDVPLSFYTLPSDSKEAPIAFADMKPMMGILEKETGVPFPWAQYGQVVVRDFTEGGMENTSFTTLFDSILRTADTENIQPTMGPTYSLKAEGLLAHELAHQWFGDLVTCKDWGHSWLNEGFATYYSLLYARSRYGNDTFLYELFKDRRVIAEDGRDLRPIVSRNYKDPREQFNLTSVYQKGSWVLQMLRVQLGDDLYHRCIKTYLERHQYQTVVTSDLISVVEELSGRSFDRFFEQWLFQTHIPEVSVSYAWQENTKLAKITVTQSFKGDKSEGENQKVGDNKKTQQPFHFPLTVRFKIKGETIDKQLEVSKADETFYVPLQADPETISIDPELGLLAVIDCSLPTKMLYSLLADKSDPVARLRACDSLATKQDDTTLAKLKDVLQNDPFYGVRMQAADSLTKIHSDAALEALIASRKQSDARVRKSVIANIGEFFHQSAQQALVECLDTEHNPAIVETAIRGLGPYHTQTVDDLLQKYLDSDSYKQRVAQASIAAIRAHEDPAFAPRLMAALKKREASFGSSDFGNALDALAYIDRNEKNKDQVRDFIAGYVNHKRERLQFDAIKALGTLGDQKALPILQTFASALKNTPQQSDAEMSIGEIRWNNKPNDNLRDMRKEVLDLEKATREQKKELQELSKRLEVYESATRKSPRSKQNQSSLKKQAETRLETKVTRKVNPN